MTNKINAASDSLFFDWHYGHQNYMPSKTNYMACSATTCHLKKATSRERLSSTACSFYSVFHRYKIPRPGLKGIYVQNSLEKWKRMFSKSCCAICSTYPESARNTSRPSRSLAMYWYLRFLNASSSASSSLSIQQAL